MSPTGWPHDATVVYRAQLEYSQKAREALRKSGSEWLRNIAVADTKPSKTPCVRIRRIQDLQHPAHGQCGLFAATKLQPRALILDYIGWVHTGHESNPQSDYDLHFLTLTQPDHSTVDLAIDASRFGNEARFINDFRGVLPRPNVEFREYRDTKTQQVRMGVFVLSVPIDKGQELCVTYGKSFWRERGVLESGK